jgi:hypothetical protein
MAGIMCLVGRFAKGLFSRRVVEDVVDNGAKALFEATGKVAAVKEAFVGTAETVKPCENGTKLVEGFCRRICQSARDLSLNGPAGRGTCVPA